MHILGLLLLALQIGFAVHALRRGEGMGWVSLIAFVPVFGCLLYVIMVLLPEMSSSRTVRRAGAAVRDTVDPKRELRERFDALDASNTVETRIGLAKELVKHGMHAEAHQLYEQSLTGIYAHDPDMLLGYADALFAARDYAKCREVLDTLTRENPDYTSQDGHLLYARALEALGETDRALDEYRSVSAYFTGAEALARYAVLLNREGQTAPAAEMVDRLVDGAKRASKHTLERNEHWIDWARREIGR